MSQVPCTAMAKEPSEKRATLHGHGMSADAGGAFRKGSRTEGVVKGAPGDGVVVMCGAACLCWPHAVVPHGPHKDRDKCGCESLSTIDSDDVGSVVRCPTTTDGLMQSILRVCSLQAASIEYSHVPWRALPKQNRSLRLA